MVVRLASWLAAVFTLGACALSPHSEARQRCDASASSDFDFWRGEWTIEQHILGADGGWLTLPAQTMVRASPDGCVLVEHWAGQVQFFWEGMERPEAIWGFSVRRYDPAQGNWSIFWMDSRRPAFDTPHVGGFSNGHGEFFRTFETSAGRRTSRISFQQPEANIVDWELAISADDGATWAPLWRMTMRRR